MPKLAFADEVSQASSRATAWRTSKPLLGGGFIVETTAGDLTLIQSKVKVYTLSNKGRDELKRESSFDARYIDPAEIEQGRRTHDICCSIVESRLRRLFGFDEVERDFGPGSLHKVETEYTRKPGLKAADLAGRLEDAWVYVEVLINEQEKHFATAVKQYLFSRAEDVLVVLGPTWEMNECLDILTRQTKVARTAAREGYPKTRFRVTTVEKLMTCSTPDLALSQVDIYGEASKDRSSGSAIGLKVDGRTPR